MFAERPEICWLIGTGLRWGRVMKEFLKTTILGGELFLLPGALVLAILGHGR